MALGLFVCLLIVVGMAVLTDAVSSIGSGRPSPSPTWSSSVSVPPSSSPGVVDSASLYDPDRLATGLEKMSAKAGSTKISRITVGKYELAADFQVAGQTDLVHYTYSYYASSDSEFLFEEGTVPAVKSSQLFDLSQVDPKVVARTVQKAYGLVVTDVKDYIEPSSGTLVVDRLTPGSDTPMAHLTYDFGSRLGDAWFSLDGTIVGYYPMSTR